METVTDLFVPGRLCLFGEHSDWAGAQRVNNPDIVPGEAIVTGIGQGIYASARKSDRFILYEQDRAENRIDCPMEAEALRRIAQAGEFYAYVAGAACCVREKYAVGGAEIRVTNMTLPVRRGLSSSAAVCVLVVRAFNRLYDLHLGIEEEMELAYRGERCTPSQCGRLDQACAFGVRPVHMRFDGDRIAVHEITLGRELHYVFADLMAHKDTVRILADLNRCYPRPRSGLEARVHCALGEENRRIVSWAMACIRSGDVQELGRIMQEAQRLFDRCVAPACPGELCAPVLHSVLADDVVRSLSYGAKGVGSQGDGSVQILARGSAEQLALVQYLRDVRQMEAYALTLAPQLEQSPKEQLPEKHLAVRGA